MRSSTVFTCVTTISHGSFHSGIHVHVCKVYIVQCIPVHTVPAIILHA